MSILHGGVIGRLREAGHAAPHAATRADGPDTAGDCYGVMCRVWM